MKNIVYSIVVMMLYLTSCEETSEIIPVEVGEDKENPIVSIKYPSDGTKIRVVEDITSIVIDTEVRDDIEVKNIKISIDGKEITTYSEFLDYRVVVSKTDYKELTNGGHAITVEATDLAGNTTSVTSNIEKVEPYKTKFDGEVFYMDFNGAYEDLVTITPATIVGLPNFSEAGKFGKAYQGSEGAYLTFPTESLNLENNFSVAFWYKVDATQERGGVFTIAQNPDEGGNQFHHGVKIIKEGTGTSFKANMGKGDDNFWNDGNADMTNFVLNSSDWTHIAFTISATETVLYFDGELVRSSEPSGTISWDNCIFSIMSGSPTFDQWNHLSDQSQMDELYIFNKTLTQTEVQTVMNTEP